MGCRCCLQGEANVKCNWDPSAPEWQHNYYQKLLPALISSWRSLFNVSFTAVVVQLAAYANPVGSGSALPMLRAAQAAGALSQPHTGLAYPIDIGDADVQQGGKAYPNPGGCNEFGGIHPRNKTEVGRRIALRLAVLEGAAPDGAADGPLPESFTTTPDGNGGRIDFSNTGSGLTLSPTADCRLLGGLGTTGDCCQTLGPPGSAAAAAAAAVVIDAPPPQCASIGGAGMCFRTMAIKRLPGLDPVNCCAACAAMPTCGAWEVTDVADGQGGICELKAPGSPVGKCSNPTQPNTTASGKSSTGPPPPPLPGAGLETFPFELHAYDGRHVAARATIDGAVVTLAPVRAADAGPFVGFRYAWQSFPLCVLANGAGLPAAPIVYAGDGGGVAA